MEKVVQISDLHLSFLIALIIWIIFGKEIFDFVWDICEFISDFFKKLFNFCDF